MTSPLIVVGAANAAAGSTTLAVPVTTTPTAGNVLLAASASGQQNATAVTDSTGGNTWTQIQTDSAEGFHQYVFQGVGQQVVGVSLSVNTFSDQTTVWGASTEFDSYVGNRPFGFNVQKLYFGEQTGANAGLGIYPSATQGNDQGVLLSALQSHGINKVLISLRPAIDANSTGPGTGYNSSSVTPAGTSFNAATEYNNLATSLTYIKSVYPNAEITLWQEPNNGKNGLTAATWQALWSFYAPAIKASGLPAVYDPSTNGGSYQAAQTYFDNNGTLMSPLPDIIAVDNYCSDWAVAHNNGTTYTFNDNVTPMENLADAHGLPFAWWETGVSADTQTPPTTYVVEYIQQQIIQRFQARLAAGKPCGDVLWYDYGAGANKVTSSTPAAQITAMEQLYDTLTQASCAPQAGSDTVTITYAGSSGVKLGAVVGLSEQVAYTPDQNVSPANGTSTTPSATSGTLAQASEVAIAVSATNNAGGSPTWGSGWTKATTEVNGSSPYLSVASKLTTSTSAVTASSTITSSTWQMMLFTFPLLTTNAGNMNRAGISMSGTVNIGTSEITASGGLTLGSLGYKSHGTSAPGTPYVIGSSAVTGLSTSITAGTNVTAGDTIQVGITCVSSPTAVTDTAGNTYTLVESDITLTDAKFYLYECDGANPLTQAVDSISVTQTTSGTLGVVAIGDDGVVGLDKFVITHGTSTAPLSPTTGTLSQPEEHAIAWIVDASAGGVPAWASPWSSNVLTTLNAGTAYVSVAYQLVNATTALTASGTITSADWVAALTTTEVAPNVITLVPTNGVVGIPYSQTLESSGGEPPRTWSISGGNLPPGLALASGVISGVPTTAGAYSYQLTVTDNLGQTANLLVSVTILSGPSGAPAVTAVSNNLLAPADADFESPPAAPGSHAQIAPAFTWSALSNAGPPFATEAIALTGDWALAWNSLADGPTAIQATAYNVIGGLPYIFSGALLPAGPGTAALAIEWLDVNGNTIQTDTSDPVTVVGATWAPLQGAFTAPLNAVQGEPTVMVQQSNAGDLNVIDMMFFTQSFAQVLVDWINPPFLMGGNAGNGFMDVSPWLRLDNNGLTYSRGRTDAISEMQPGSGSFELQNDLGEFAQDNSVSYPVVLGGGLMTLQRRAQINMADENGQWWTRYDGPVAEIDYDFDNTGLTSLAQIAMTDILAPNNRQDPLFCWTKEQVLADGPAFHWPLDDPGTAGGAGAVQSGAFGIYGIVSETSGNNGPAMRVVSSDTTKAATITWQDTTGGVETLADAASATGNDGASYWTAGSNQPSSLIRGLISGNVGPFTTPIGSILLTPVGMSSSPWTTPTETSQNTFVSNTGFMLEAELPTPIAPTATGSDYSIECWFMPDTTLATNISLDYGPFIVFALGNSRQYTNLQAGIFLSSGTANIECATYAQPPAFKALNWGTGAGAYTPTASFSAPFTPDASAKRPHHLVVTIQGDPSAATVTMWLDGVSIGTLALPKGQVYDTITCGGAYGGCGVFFGNLSLLSVYPYELAPQQITQHCMLGQYGMWEQTTDNAIALVAEFSGIPSFWSNLQGQNAGLTMTEYLDITNSNGISIMQQYEQAEVGLLFVNAMGQLTFHTRDWRMGYGAPDLLLSPGVFNAELSYKLVDQFQCNEEGISGPNTLGATATSLVAGSNPGQTVVQTSTSTLIQAGYINTASQAEYGTYAANPVSSPLALPLLTWSRGYAALGLTSFSYYADPNLTDRAAWDANSRSDPWFLPAEVSIDLLTLDPTSGLAISNFYALDIDNMIAPTPDTLPPSFPNAQTSVEWFIEGITETMTVDSREISFYTSPAEPQRAWKPGDPTYGVLGETTRLGISTADLSTPQADGKDVSHDGGPPYWPPSFTATMNAPAIPNQDNGPLPQGNGFVGASDMRGIAQNLQTMLQPPICVVGAISETQTFTNGALSGTTMPGTAQVFWDNVFVDTAGGMGQVPGYPNWYLVVTPGFYEIDLSVTLAATPSEGGYTAQAWIVVAQAAAQALAAGVANPLTVDQYVCPVGEAVRFNSSNVTPVCAGTTRMYLGVGDMVCAAVEQNYTSSWNTATSNAASIMSLRFVGLGKVDDRTMINTAISNGGTVSLKSRGIQQTASFPCTHTYSYQGTKGFSPNARRNADGNCFQGLSNAADEGSNASQIAFNVANIQSTLSGHTVLSATLTGTNISSNYSTGVKLMLGTTKDTPGGSKWDADDSHTTDDILRQKFTSGQVLTFSIPTSMVTAFISGGAQALSMGDSDTTDLNYSGQWDGGPDSWTLEVNYV